MQFDAVIFDMDGLLLDSERIAQKAGAEACAAMGLDVPHWFFVDHLMGKDYKSGAALLQDFLGGTVNMDRLNTLWSAASDRLMKAGLPLRPGVIEVLDHVDACGLPKAIATSTETERAWIKLGKAGLDHRFETLVGVDCIAAPKPAPDPYLKAAELLGMPPARCLAFEDSDTGVRAAVAAGMTVVQVPDLKPSTDQLAHVTAHDLITGARAVGLMQ